MIVFFTLWIFPIPHITPIFTCIPFQSARSSFNLQPRLTLGACEAVRLRSDFSMSFANAELGFHLAVFVPGEIPVRQVVPPG